MSDHSAPPSPALPDHLRQYLGLQGQASPPVPDAAAHALAHLRESRRSSVATRVAELHRLYPTEMAQQMAQQREERKAEIEMDTAVCTAAMGTLARGALPPSTPAKAVAPLSDLGSDADGQLDAEQKRGLLGWLLRLLSAGSDELLTWASWKVYDILWAVLLLYLGRRFRWARRLQEF